jgi:hypothetical protein
MHISKKINKAVSISCGLRMKQPLILLVQVQNPLNNLEIQKIECNWFQVEDSKM